MDNSCKTLDDRQQNSVVPEQGRQTKVSLQLPQLTSEGCFLVKVWRKVTHAELRA